VAQGDSVFGLGILEIIGLLGTYILSCLRLYY